MIFVKTKRTLAKTGKPARTGYILGTKTDPDTGKKIARVQFQKDKKPKLVEVSRLALNEGVKLDVSLTHCTCGRRFAVVESRNQVIGATQTVWRRRKCAVCGGRSTTLEIDEETALMILEGE